MKHTVTVTYEVEAPAWDLAIEAVLLDPLDNLMGAKVKSPGKQLIHVASGNLIQAALQLSVRNRDE